MADWFKFYNNWLDDPKIQFAISEHPQVLSVLLLILSEASKNRSDSVPWSDKDYELFAFSRKLNVTVPIINECVNLLCKVEFIARRRGSLKILNWNKLQSEYCRGKDRGYYAKKAPSTSETLASTSLESRTRGEESRGDEKRGGTGKAPMFPSDVRKELDDLNAEIKAFRGRHLTVTASGSSWDSDDSRQKHLALVEQRDAIKASLRKMAASSSFTP